MKKLFFALFVTVVIFVVVICVKDKPAVPIEEHNETSVSDNTVTDNVESTEFLHQGDSETLSKAPRVQDCFPITFFCNSQTVTVNEPVFTGIPTDTVLSYKKHYAFQNGSTVFEVMTSDGTHKYFLVSRNGEILDRDYTSSSNVSDIASLCRYEGVKKVQEGESWNYKQKLVSLDGEILSETFDFIGYFYNSIAIVEQDGKIGFIDSKGNTLVRPCIQYDDLRYPPDYKGFWLYHIQEDAFVLPIDGEFAIITLTREGEVAPVREVSIEFPEDFSYDEYEFPEVSDTSELEFGDFVPWASCNERYYERYESYHDYLFFTDGCESVADARDIYTRINEKYMVEIPKISGYVYDFYDYKIDDEQYGNLYTDFLFKSHLVYFSSDLDRVGRYRFVYNGANERTSLLYHDWTVIYELLENGEVCFAKQIDNTSVHAVESDAYVKEIDNLPDLHHLYHLAWVDDKLCIYENYEAKNGRTDLFVYSLEKRSVECVINVPFDGQGRAFRINQCVDGRYFLFEVYDASRTSGEDFWAAYLFDLEPEKLTKLEDYAFNAFISPDLKHLVYTGNFGGQWGYDCGVNNPQGYYIKEIESGKTWFYEHDVGYYEFKGWVNKAKLKEIQ